MTKIVTNGREEINAPSLSLRFAISETNTIIPGLGFFWDTNFASLSLNFQYPIFLNVVMAESGSTDLNAEANAWQVSMSMRKVLDYTIPWLYW